MGPAKGSHSVQLAGTPSKKATAMAGHRLVHYIGTKTDRLGRPVHFSYVMVPKVGQPDAANTTVKVFALHYCDTPAIPFDVLAVMPTTDPAKALDFAQEGLDKEPKHAGLKKHVFDVT